MNLLLFSFCHSRAGDLLCLIELAKRGTFNDRCFKWFPGFLFVSGS